MQCNLNEFTPKSTSIYLNGFTPNSTGQIRPGMQCNLNEFTPKSTSIYLNGFTPNSTGQIGCKSIEIMTTKFDQAAILCTGRHTNVISVNFYPIQPVINARSNSTGRIGSRSIEIMTTKFDQECNVISMNLHPN